MKIFVYCDGNTQVIYESDPGTTGQDSYQIDTGARKPGSYWIVATSSKANNSPQTDFFDIGQYLPGEAPTSKIFFDGGDAYTVGGNWYIAHSGKENVRCRPVDKDADYLGSVVDDSFNVDGAIQWAGPQQHPAGEYSAPNKRRTRWTAPSEGQLTYVVLYLDDDGRYYDDFSVPTQVQSVEVGLFTLTGVSLDRAGEFKYEPSIKVKATADYMGNLSFNLLYELVNVDSGKVISRANAKDSHTFELPQGGHYLVRVTNTHSPAKTKVESYTVTCYQFIISPENMLFSYNPGGSVEIQGMAKAESSLAKLTNLANEAVSLEQNVTTSAQAVATGMKALKQKAIARGLTNEYDKLVDKVEALGKNHARKMKLIQKFATTLDVVSLGFSVYDLATITRDLNAIERKASRYKALSEKYKEALESLTIEPRKRLPSQELTVIARPGGLKFKVVEGIVNWETKDDRWPTDHLLWIMGEKWDRVWQAGKAGTSEGSKRIYFNAQGNLGFCIPKIVYKEQVVGDFVAEVDGLTKEEALQAAQVKLSQEKAKAEALDRKIEAVQSAISLLVGGSALIALLVAGATAAATILLAKIALIVGLAILVFDIIYWLFSGGSPLETSIEENYPSSE